MHGIVISVLQVVALVRQVGGQRQIEQEVDTLLERQVREVVDGSVLAEQQRVARQMLRVADHGEAAAHAGHHHRILAALC